MLDAYASFSPELADVARRFFEQSWIDAPVRPGKRPGAFCAYTVPSHHPYLLLNWTARRRDVLTLAHELGHGLHAYLARAQGVFHQTTPLTLAETASVFGETVTFGRLLGETTDPAARLALLAESLEGQIATVFRQIAMNRFEDAVHTERRERGELSTDRFGELWAATQTDMLGDAVEITEGYRTWWSYIPHFIGTPGYVYAYAYGQLLALSVYRQYEERGAEFVPSYLELLSRGGSASPEELGRIVGVDLADPAFWDGGLAIVEEQLAAAEDAAARPAGSPDASVPGRQAGAGAASSRRSWARPIGPRSRARAWKRLEVERVAGRVARVGACREPLPLADLVADRLAGESEVAVDLAGDEVRGHLRAFDHELERELRVPGLARVIALVAWNRELEVQADVDDDACRRASPGPPACRARTPGRRGSRARP